MDGRVDVAWRDGNYNKDRTENKDRNVFVRIGEKKKGLLCKWSLLSDLSESQRVLRSSINKIMWFFDAVGL